MNFNPISYQDNEHAFKSLCQDLDKFGLKGSERVEIRRTVLGDKPVLVGKKNFFSRIIEWIRKPHQRRINVVSEFLLDFFKTNESLFAQHRPDLLVKFQPLINKSRRIKVRNDYASLLKKVQDSYIRQIKISPEAKEASEQFLKETKAECLQEKEKQCQQLERIIIEKKRAQDDEILDYLKQVDELRNQIATQKEMGQNEVSSLEKQSAVLKNEIEILEQKRKEFCDIPVKASDGVILLSSFFLKQIPYFNNQSTKEMKGSKDSMEVNVVVQTDVVNKQWNLE